MCLAFVGRLWYSICFFLIKLISLLGKNFAEDTADFGKDSLASKRHFDTGRPICFAAWLALRGASAGGFVFSVSHVAFPLW